MHRETIGAIDIGSNAIRLLINYVEPHNDGGVVAFKKAAFVRVPIRLGEDVFEIGEVGEEKLGRLVEAIRGFSALLKTFNVEKYRACATSAMREAKNSAKVLESIRQQTCIEIEIISGRQEAQTIFEAGGISGLLVEDKSYLFVDVGGGSTEVTIYCGGVRVKSESFLLGTVRMLSGRDTKAEFLRFKAWLKENTQGIEINSIVGSGGNINKVYKQLGKKPPEVLLHSEIKSLNEQLLGMTYQQRIEKLGLNAYRADVIIPALKIFLTVCKVCSIQRIEVPRIGLADGIIYNLYYSGL